MDEQFLHYIWRYQKFKIRPLQLTNGQSLTVFYPGNHNQDSGPDFEEARIKIDAIEWAGQVEIHVHSSDWIRHKHDQDKAYKSVILHVVWINDKEILIDGSPIPSLELKSLVDLRLLEKYKLHLNSTNEIPCANQITKLSSLHINGMLDKVLIERLNGKSSKIFAELKQLTDDWEHTTYVTLASNFGFSTNKEIFSRLVELLPHGILKKVLNNLKSTEALVFGQAGFLENVFDDYQRELKLEYDFLSKKFRLKQPLARAQWKFGKMRPPNFPSVRLSQFAALLHSHPKLFTFLAKTEAIAEIKDKLMVDVSDYWQRHYDFGKAKKIHSKKMGERSFENLLINSVAPLLASYSIYTGDQKYMDRAIGIIESLPNENNRITKKWNSIGIRPKTAFDSQALIQLYQNYCQPRKCLLCNIGVELLK